MQKIRQGSVGKVCLALLSLALLTQTAFGYDVEQVSYLDNVSSSYLYNQPTEETNILNMNSIDARAIETTLKLDSSPVITNSTSKINLSLRDSDLKQTLRMLADKAGLNIIFDKSIEGKITLDLNNITLNDAFMVIFKSTQLAYTMDGNTITVMTIDAAKEVAYTRKYMTTIPIKYVNAQQVAEFLNTNLFKSNIFGLSKQPIVTSNPRTNQIIVFGSDSDVNAIKRVLPTLDTKPMVNTFKVNHVTPKEMAKLICESLFYDVDVDDDDGDDDDDKVILGGGTVACKDESNGGRQGGGQESLASFNTTPLSVAFFTQSGKIATYGGSVEQVEIIRDFIKEHDKKQLMAYIELSVIELNETGSKEFSNSWSLWTPFIALGLDPSSGLSTSSLAPFFIWGNKVPTGEEPVKSSDGDYNEKQFIHKASVSSALTYSLKYILENGNGRVLTNPKIMVTNGKKTTIDMTSDYVKTVTTQILQGSDTVTSASQKTYDIGSDEGILIEIVPFISPDGYVSMNITPEFATIKERIYATSESGEGQDLQATLLQRRDLELKNIRIKDGETLVLAGLIKENETQTVKKLPILSDLPLIGAFFRSSAQDKSREELVIVVTPHIVKDGEEISEDGKVYDL